MSSSITLILLLVGVIAKIDLLTSVLAKESNVRSIGARYRFRVKDESEITASASGIRSTSDHLSDSKISRSDVINSEITDGVPQEREDKQSHPERRISFAFPSVSFIFNAFQIVCRMLLISNSLFVVGYNTKTSIRRKSIRNP